MSEKLLFPDAPLRREDFIKHKKSRKEQKLARDSEAEFLKRVGEKEKNEALKSEKINRPIPK